MSDTFGELLQRFRNKAEFSQKEVADLLYDKLGKSFSKGNTAISKWENDVHCPNEEVVDELEDILKVPGGLLLGAAGYGSAAENKMRKAGEHLDREDNLLWSVYAARYREHLENLRALAKELISDIENCRISTKPQKRIKTKAPFGGIQPNFRSQDNPLWPFLLQHLDNEFRDPLFSKQCQGMELAYIITRLSKPDQLEFAHDMVDQVKGELILVSERGTFKGTCKVCEGWFIDKTR